MNDPRHDLKEEMKESYLGILKVMEKRYDWLRSVLTVAAGIIGAVVALRSGQLHSWIEYWLFCLSIGLLCVGLVFGCIALYGEHMKLLFIQKAILRTGWSSSDQEMRHLRKRRVLYGAIGNGPQ
jgi:hypothetical protein